jgi:hypothetical protein
MCRASSSVAHGLPGIFYFNILLVCFNIVSQWQIALCLEMFSIHMSKRVVNNYIDLELSQPYDALVLNGHHCTHSYRHTVLQLRELNVHVHICSGK